MTFSFFFLLCLCKMVIKLKKLLPYRIQKILPYVKKLEKTTTKNQMALFFYLFIFVVVLTIFDYYHWCPSYDAKLHLIVRLQNFRERGVPFLCYYFSVYSELAGLQNTPTAFLTPHTHTHLQSVSWIWC